jgi:hypothetical protein
MSIIFDNDDTLHYHNKPFELFLAKEKGIITTISNYQLWSNWNGTYEEAIAFLKEFYESPYGNLQLPIPGMSEILQFYKEQGETIYVVSSRKYSQEKAVSAIKQNYGAYIDDIIFRGDYRINRQGETKGTIAKQLGGTIAFEDAYHQAKHLAEAGLQCHLFNHLWNISYEQEHTNIYRHNSPEETLDFIKRK